MSSGSMVVVEVFIRQSTALQRPRPLNTGAVPAHDHVWVNCMQHRAPAGRIARKYEPKHAINSGYMWPFHGALEHDDLLPERKISQQQDAAAFEHRPKGRENSQEQNAHLPANASTPHRKSQLRQCNRVFGRGRRLLGLKRNGSLFNG